MSSTFTYTSKHRQAVFKRLRSVGIDIETDIENEVVYTPADWRSMYGVFRGAVVSLSLSLSLSLCADREAVRKFMQIYLPCRYKHPYVDLNAAGGGTGTGTVRKMGSAA